MYTVPSTTAVWVTALLPAVSSSFTSCSIDLKEKEFSALICTIEALLVLIHLSQKSPISVTAIIPPKHTGFTKELLDPGYKKDAKSGYSSALAAHSSRFNSSSCSPHSMRCTKRRLSEEHPVQHRQNSCQVCQSKF